MSTTGAIAAFTLAAGLLTITPGLDTALVLRTAAVEGARPAMRAGFGICTGVFAWGIAAAAGLGALLAVSTLAYDVLRAAGALYLTWLGLRMFWRSFARDGVGPLAATDRSPARGWFLRGLMTNLLNPKVGVFYVTLMPQFIPPGADVVPFSLLLAAIHNVEGVLWFLLLTRATEPLSRWLRRPAVARALDRATGGVLILFGARLAFERR